MEDTVRLIIHIDSRKTTPTFPNYICLKFGLFTELCHLGPFLGPFSKERLRKWKWVMGPFEIWNKQNVARTPLVTSTSPPPPFALFQNVTFSVPKRDTTFLVDCIDSTVPLPPKHIKSIIDSLSYQQTFTFTFLQLFLCVLPGRNME